MKRSHLIQCCLLSLGAFAWVATGASLKKDGNFEFQPNVLTLKGSPFGRTVAVAMRGPVDIYWNQGEVHSHDDHECSGAGCSHAGHEEESQEGSAANLLNGVRNMSDEVSMLPSDHSFRGGLLDQIADWNSAYYTRTNPYGSSKIHKAFIMGETQKRLRLSYEMDPSNFSAYGSYFLFLSEALSTYKEDIADQELQKRASTAALQLSRHTVRYCLAHRDEPGALLTAAAASHDYLQTLYREEGDGAMAEVQQIMQVQYECLREFEKIRSRMIAEGSWDKLPGLRRQEMDVHVTLLRKLYEVNLQMVGNNAVSGKRDQPHLRKSS